MICHVEVVKVIKKPSKKKGPSSQIYRPGTELDTKFSLAFVALSLTLERGEMAFKEVL
jgi:hypothetical protein